MNIITFMLHAVLLMCSGFDIAKMRPSEAYNIKNFRHNIENSNGDKQNDELYKESSLRNSEPNRISTMKNIRNLTDENDINNVKTVHLVDRSIFHNKINHSMYADNTDKHQADGSSHVLVNHSTLSARGYNKTSDVIMNNTKESVETTHKLSFANKNHCVSDCEKHNKAVQFSVRPMNSHFLSGSSFTLVCDIPVNINLVSQMFFQFEGIHSIGFVCKSTDKNTAGCIHFPSIEWKIVSKENESIYSEELTIQNIDESFSGYYICVVKFRCCGTKGTYITDVTGEMNFPISIESFAKYRTAIIVIGSSVILIFLLSTLLLCKRNFCHNFRLSDVFKHKLEKNRSLKEFSFMSAPFDESNRFIQ